jgi:hypothetical protein
MPFVTLEHREKPDLAIPGDLCYIYYVSLVDAWKKEPRWTTAHNLFKKMVFQDLARPMSEDMITAAQLAWQVFFQLYVMEYEKVKRQENGDI